MSRSRFVTYWVTSGLVESSTVLAGMAEVDPHRARLQRRSH
jgi:hypothetical protein